jgi:beta-glucosidase
MANPPARGGRGGFGGPGGRGGRGGGNQIRVALDPPALPDLSEAKTADAAIVCVGLNRNMESEGRDRRFDLFDLQQHLISAVSAANPHTIVINNSGAAVGMAGWIGKTAAVLHAWYLGQEGGLAVGSVLFGDFNPCGHLCSSFDRTFEENPAFAYYPGTTPAGSAFPVEPYTEGIFYGYRGYDKTGKDPLFPFGYGLSYTSFKFSNLRCTKSGAGVTVSLDVKNTGRRAGAEVVQVYIGEKDCPLPRPKRELKGFGKVLLQAGETRRIEIGLPRDAFAYWSPVRKDWTVDSGHKFTIEAAASERDIRLKETVRVD